VGTTVFRRRGGPYFFIRLWSCPTDPTAAALLLCSYVGYGTDRDAVNGYVDWATVQLGLWMEAPSERAAWKLRLFLYAVAALLF
jgi:hypothetical protein